MIDGHLSWTLSVYHDRRSCSNVHVPNFNVPHVHVPNVHVLHAHVPNVQVLNAHVPNVHVLNGTGDDFNSIDSLAIVAEDIIKSRPQQKHGHQLIRSSQNILERTNSKNIYTKI